MVVEMVGSEGYVTSNLTDSVRALVRVTRMLEHASTELSLPQYRLLVMVSRGDQRASKLALRLALSKPTVTAVVDGLVERGLLVRSEVPGDRRAVELSLTEAGGDALARADAAMGERLARVLDHCTDPDSSRSALLQLAAAVELVVAERVAEVRP
jgi:DNA-binding MarR family transcriptional regulator